MDGTQPADPNSKHPASSDSAEEQAKPSFTIQYPEEDRDLYLPPTERSKPKWKRTLGKALLIILIVALVTVLGFGVYRFFVRSKPERSAAQQNKTSEVTQPTDAFAAAGKTYTSPNLNLSIDYPGNWKVSDDANKLKITSLLTTLPGTDGQNVQGRIVLAMQPKGTELEAFASGGVISALDSQKIKYSKPTPVQRGETYLTFLQYTDNFVKGQLDGIYITGDYGYKANQYVPKVDIAKLDPLITMTFEKCSANDCGDPQPLSIQSEVWANDAKLQKGIATMLQSLQVQ